MANFEKFLGDLDQFRNLGRAQGEVPSFSPKDKALWETVTQDLILFSTNSRRLSIQSHEKFSAYFNSLSEGGKSNVEIIRPFWLGLSSPLKQPIFTNANEIEKFISERLIQDILELSVSYKMNFDRTPFALKRRAENTPKGHRPRLFRDWFSDHYGNSSYAFKLITALADGKTKEYIRNEIKIPKEISLWGFKGIVLSDAELEKIQEALSLGEYTPKLFDSRVNSNLKSFELREEVDFLRLQNEELTEKLNKLLGEKNK